MRQSAVEYPRARHAPGVITDTAGQPAAATCGGIDCPELAGYASSCNAAQHREYALHLVTFEDGYYISGWWRFDRIHDQRIVDWSDTGATLALTGSGSEARLGFQLTGGFLSAPDADGLDQSRFQWDILTRSDDYSGDVALVSKTTVDALSNYLIRLLSIGVANFEILVSEDAFPYATGMNTSPTGNLTTGEWVHVTARKGAGSMQVSANGAGNGRRRGCVATGFDGDTLVSLPSGENRLDIEKNFALSAFVHTRLGQMGTVISLENTMIDGFSTRNTGISLRIDTQGRILVHLGHYASESLSVYSSTNQITAGTWAHVAVTRAGGALSFYIDGQPTGDALCSDLAIEWQAISIDHDDYELGRRQYNNAYLDTFDGRLQR